MTDKYAVVGNPIAHSKSPIIHAFFAEQTKQNLSYQAILVEPTEFDVHIKQLIADGFKGFNVTSPFKEMAYQLADESSERARAAGAVNTLSVQANGRLFGDNTDGVGLLRDLQNNLHITLKDKRILLLGAGGAARGIISLLLRAAPDHLVIANRTASRAETLATAFGELGNITACSMDDIPAEPFDIVINATSAGLLGKDVVLPTIHLSKSAVCYDMTYGLTDNQFLLWAEQHGAQKTQDGLGMLVEQAAESFYIWRGVHPNTAPVIQHLLS